MRAKNFDQYFWLNRLLLCACGVLRFQNNCSIFNIFFIVSPFAAAGFLSFPTFYSLFFAWNKLKALDRAKIITELAQHVFGALKVGILMLKRKRVLGMVQLCSSLWLHVKDQEDFDAVRFYSERGFFLTCGFGLNVLGALISTLLRPLFVDFVYDTNGTMIQSKQLPFSAGIFHENEMIYNIWYGLQVPVGLMCIVSIIGADTAVAFFVLQGCAHLKLVQDRFGRITSSTDEEEKSTGVKIADCIRHHQEIILYSEAVQDVFNSVVLLQTILSISVICGYGFNLLVQKGEEARFVVHLIGATLQLLMFCWPPDDLQTESTAVAQSAYQLPWVSLRIEKKTTVRMIIMRSQKPAFVTAGGFSIMSLEMFMSILSSAMSFFTVLRTVM